MTPTSNPDASERIQAQADAISHCPDCTTAIKPGRVLITYETADGRAGYAECPDCLDVVRVPMA